MRCRRSAAVPSIAFAAAALCCGAGATGAEDARRPIPFPAGYDFPADAAKLNSYVTNRDIAALRRHAWFLWAGVNQPGRDGWPIWRSWYIPTQAFAQPIPKPKPGELAAAGAGAGMSLAAINKKNNPPINLAIPVYLIPDAVRKKHEAALKGITDSSTIPDGENFQNNGDLMLVAEPYSEPAFRHIRGKHLYETLTLQKRLDEHKIDIQQFPRRSIVLKHMYWPVAKDKLTALPLVDMSSYATPANPDTTYVGFENMDRWKQAVAIDPTRETIPQGETADVTYLYDVQHPSTNQPWGPNTYGKAKVVPLRDFYFKKLTRKDYEALSTYDQVLIDLSFYWVHKRPFQDGDYLVAVASHVVTKEMPSWTLQTFWWHDKPDAGDYAKDRPDIPQAKGPWRHYLMTVEDGVLALTGGNSLPIAYNPYIELASHPVVTNCRNCHTRAAWPNGQYIQSPGPDALADIKLDDPIFKGKVHTDILWTIPDRAKGLLAKQPSAR